MPTDAQRRNMASAHRAEVQGLTERIALLEQQLAEARKDSERLDWFAKNAGQHTVSIGGKWYVREGYGSPHIRAGSIRSAIDAAITSTQEQT